jgi:hypothetical protein
LLKLKQGKLAAEGVADDIASGASELLTNAIQATLEVAIEADSDGVFHVRQCKTIGTIWQLRRAT